MRAAVYYANDDVRVEEMPLPRIGPGELLVKVIASGICGSDVMEWYRLGKAPLVLGHEIAGEIVPEAQEAKPAAGQRLVWGPMPEPVMSIPEQTAAATGEEDGVAGETEPGGIPLLDQEPVQSAAVDQDIQEASLETPPDMSPEPVVLVEDAVAESPPAPAKPAQAVALLEEPVAEPVAESVVEAVAEMVAETVAEPSEEPEVRTVQPGPRTIVWGKWPEPVKPREEN